MSCQLFLGRKQYTSSPISRSSASSSARWVQPGYYSGRSVSNLCRRSTMYGCYKNDTCEGGEQRRHSIQGVKVDPNLLQPLHINISPEIEKVKHLEMEQMKSLNNQFVAFIDEVQRLEEENQLLSTRWSILQNQAVLPRENLETLFDQYLDSLRRQLDALRSQNVNLEADRNSTQELAADAKLRYEEKLKQHTAALKDFAKLKKEEDCVSVTNAELEEKVRLLSQNIQFLKCFYEKERTQLDNHAGEQDVVVKMDNRRNFNTEGIIAAVKKQYEEIVQRSKAEADTFYQNKFKEAQNKQGGCQGNLKKIEQEISELTKEIEKLQCEIQSVQKENAELQKAVCDTTEEGDCALKDARKKYSELVEALRNSKDELAGLVRKYQEILNVKLTLDMEIAAYRSLLEGEEQRLSKDFGNSVSTSNASSCSPNKAKPRSGCPSKDVNSSGLDVPSTAVGYKKNRCQSERLPTKSKRN